jgi:Uma2 family endonuclease
MAMPVARAEWTVDMLDALPDDGNRYELIDGELFVTPAPSDLHQLVVGALHSRLRAYMRPTFVGRALMSPSDVRREDRRRNRVQPDIFVVRLADNARPPYPFQLSDLLLAVEVESPSNTAYDYQTKRELYLRNGVPEYWIVSPEARTFARWRRLEDPAELLTQRFEWQPIGLPGPLVIDLPEFFEDAFG